MSVYSFTQDEYDRAYDFCKRIWPNYSDKMLEYAIKGKLGEWCFLRHLLANGFYSIYGRIEDEILKYCIFAENKYNDDGGADFILSHDESEYIHPIYQVKTGTYSRTDYIILKNWQYTKDLRYRRNNLEIDRFAFCRYISNLEEKYIFEVVGTISNKDFLKNAKYDVCDVEDSIGVQSKFLENKII